MRQTKIVTLFFVGCISVFLAGCGNTNLFKSLVGDPRPAPSSVAEAVTRIQESNDSGNYAEAITLAQDVIDSTTATPIQKIEANTLKGVALLGDAGFQSTDLGQTISDAANNGNLLNSLPDLPVEKASNAAVALNQAAQLATDNSVVLDADSQLTRGIANTSVIVSKINELFDIDDSGNATPKNSATQKEALNDLLTSDGLGGTIVEYAANASDAFSKSGALNTDQQNEVDKVKGIPQELESLHNVVKDGGSGSYTIGSITITPSSSDDDVEAAINAILNTAN